MARSIPVCILALLLVLPGSVARAANESGNEEKVEEIKIDSKLIPFHKDFSLASGATFRLVLPNGKEFAAWCRPTASCGVERLLEPQDLVLDWGEKPFEKLKIKIGYSGHTVIDTHDSYIRTHSVVTYSDSVDEERDFYVEEYKIVLHTKAVKKEKLPVRVDVRLATEREREDVLIGEEEKAYFLSRLQAKDAAVRCRAVDKLVCYVDRQRLGERFDRNGLRPEGKAIREAIGALRDDADKQVRDKVEAGLRTLGDEGAVLRFVAPAPPKDRRTSHCGFVVAEWCSNGEGDKAAAHIIRFLDDKDDGLVVFALGFFRFYKYPRAEEKLLKLLAHSSSRVRLEAAVELRTNEEAKKQIPMVLAKLFEDPNKEVRCEALREARRWQEELGDVLIAATKDKDLDVRSAAIYSLNGCKAESARDAVFAATRDPSPRIRCEAVGSLGHTDQAKGFNGLVEMLSDEDSGVRICVLYELADYPGERALPKLRQRRTNEKDDDVRTQLEKLIERIERIPHKSRP